MLHSESPANDFVKGNAELKFAIDAGLQLLAHKRDIQHRDKSRRYPPIESSSSHVIRSLSAIDKLSIEPVAISQESVMKWNELEVADWLTLQGFKQYTDAFLDNMINGPMLVSLADSDLERDLRVTNRMHRKRLMLEVAKLAVKGKSSDLETNAHKYPIRDA